LAENKDWKTSSGLGILAIILIVVAVGGGYWFMNKNKTPVLKSVKSIVLDEETGEIFDMEIPSDPNIEPPYKSPKTENMTVYRALQCQNCSTIYPWKEKNMPDNQCPRCKNKVPTPLSFVPGAIPQQK